MTTPSPGRLEFTDCLGCGKRVATTAPLCRHCNTKRTPVPVTLKANIRRPSSPDYDERDGELDRDGKHDQDSHAALGLGGYGNDDIDDELEADSAQAKKKGLWWYVALVLLIVFSIGALIPWF